MANRFFVRNVLYILVLVSSTSEGRRFVTRDEDGDVCSILEATFNISLLAWRGGTALQPFYILSESASGREHVTVQGNCETFMSVSFGEIVSWEFYLGVSKSLLPSLGYSRTVQFLPQMVYPHDNTSPQLKVFRSPPNTLYEVQSEEASYKCSTEHSSYYDDASPELEGDVTYKVLVKVSDIQVQVTKVREGKFNKAILCHSMSVHSSHNRSETDLRDRKLLNSQGEKEEDEVDGRRIALIVGCVVGGSVTLVFALFIFHRKRAGAQPD